MFRKTGLRLGLLLLSLNLFVQCNDSPVSIQVKGFPESTAIAFAEKELTSFMMQAME